MKIEINKKFVKDASRLPSEIQLLIKSVILNLEEQQNFNDFDVKKLKGHKTAYRIKLGSYRIGFYFENNTVYLERVLHRKDVYKFFP